MARTQVQSELIATNAISGTIIADGAITSTHLAANCVDSSELVTGSIDTIHIAANQVTSAKIVSDGVLTRHIADDQITGDKLTNNITIAGTLTSTGDITGTLATAAQTNITSLGTLTALTGGTGDLVWDTTTLVVDSSDNSVGMGTASPSSYNSNTRNLVIRDSGSGGITISTGASNTGYVAFNDGEDTTIEGLIAYNQSNDVMSFRTASTDDRLVIDGSGKVGIGDASPIDYLEINGSGSGLGGLTISNSTHNHAALSFARSAAATARIYITEPDATHTSQMYFQTSDASGSAPNLVTAMSIDEAQRVGIGTTSPEGALDVNIGTAGVWTGVFDNTASGGAGVLIKSAGATGSENLLDVRNGDGTKFVIKQSDGKVGIGETSPDRHLHITGAGANDGRIKLENTDNTYYAGLVMTSASNEWHIGVGGSSTNAGYASSLYFHENGDGLRMTLNDSGVLIIGDTTTHSGGHDAVSRLQLTGGGSVLAIKQSQVNDASHRVVSVFTDSGGTYRGRITINNSACSFTSASDYRLKENIETLPNGLDRLKQLKPVKFKWKEHDYTSEGFIAHEVQEVYPDAIVGEKDDKVMQSMDYGKITPLLVKAIQEQQTIIDNLTSRIETLEG